MRSDSFAVRCRPATVFFALFVAFSLNFGGCSCDDTEEIEQDEDAGVHDDTGIDTGVEDTGPDAAPDVEDTGPDAEPDVEDAGPDAEPDVEDTGPDAEPDAGPNDEVDPFDFAFQSLDDPQRIRLALLEEEDQWPVTDPDPNLEDTLPRIAPDGRSIAFSRGDLESGIYDLFLLDLVDGSVTRLTEIGETEECLIVPINWDPSGDRLGFGCTGDVSQGEVILGHVTVEGEVTLFDPPGQDVFFLTGFFLPDGDWLVHAFDLDTETEELRRLDPDDPSSTGEVLVSFDDLYFLSGLALSRDGSEVAAIHAFDPFSEPSIRQITIANLVDGTYHQILGDDEESLTAAGPHYVLDWHPDGDRLLVASGSHEEGFGVLRIVDAATGEDQTMLAMPEDLTWGTLNGEFAPGGDFVLFTDSDSDFQIWNEGSLYRVDTDGTGMQILNFVANLEGSGHSSFNPTLYD